MTTGVDDVIPRTDSSGAFTPEKDMLGSTIELMDAGGNLSTQYAYDPFGNTSVSGVTNSNVFQYTRRENEGNGLNFCCARYYSPLLGRFISEDPLGLREVKRIFTPMSSTARRIWSVRQDLNLAIY